MTLTQSSLNRTSRIQRARDTGYTNEQILDAFIQKGYGDRIQKARSLNFSDEEIINAFEASLEEQQPEQQLYAE